MGRDKLRRFLFNEQSDYVIQPGKAIFEKVKGHWNELIFKNNKPIKLEIGCGRGEYTIGQARLLKDVNFIGVDIKGSRLWKGATICEEESLHNAAFLRTEIALIEKLFEKGEVDEIWVTFPDPRPKDKDEKHRLISPRFLGIYRSIMKEDGIINLKTDNYDLYAYAEEVVKEQKLDILASTSDLYTSEYQELCMGIQTTYEKRFLTEGIKINYLRFKLNARQ